MRFAVTSVSWVRSCGLKRRAAARRDHVIVHVILRIIDYSFLGILLFGGIYLLFGDQAIPKDITEVMASLVAIVGLGFGWGVLNLVLSRRSRIWNFIFPSISRILVLFSGVFFVPDFLAADTRDVLSFTPMMHAVPLFRPGFYPQYTALLLDVHYLAYFAICSLLLGLMVERVTRRFEGR